MIIDLHEKSCYNLRMNISTMYSIMLTLINNKKVSREYVATKYEISSRTVQRYIDALITSGVPIDAILGKNGGYTISDDYKLPFTLFTQDDISRIKTCLNALSHTFKDELTTDLIDKLSALAGGRVNVLSSLPMLVIDSSAWNNPNGLSAKFDAIIAAISRGVTVDIDYTDRVGQNLKRKLDPYSVALKEGVWYVYGWCHIHNEFRLFRLARMKSIDVLDELIERHDGGDVRSALSVMLGTVIKVELEITSACLPKIEEWLGADSIKADGDRLIAEASISDSEELVRKILSFGGEVKVLSPKSLSERVKKIASDIANQYTEFSSKKI